MFPSAPIFQQYNYFRQNIEEKSLSLSIFISFASNFLCKILWDNKNIDANISIFQITFWQWCLPLTKKLFWGVFLTAKWFTCVPNFHFVRHQQQMFCQYISHFFQIFGWNILFTKFLEVFTSQKWNCQIWVKIEQKLALYFYKFLKALIVWIAA